MNSNTRTLWLFQAKSSSSGNSNRDDQEKEQGKEQEQPQLDEPGTEQIAAVDHPRISSTLGALLRSSTCSLAKLQLWLDVQYRKSDIHERTRNILPHVTFLYNFRSPPTSAAADLQIGVFEFAAALPFNSTLQVLHLRCAGIGDDEAKRLSEG